MLLVKIIFLQMIDLSTSIMLFFVQRKNYCQLVNWRMFQIQILTTIYNRLYLFVFSNILKINDQ